MMKVIMTTATRKVALQLAALLAVVLFVIPVAWVGILQEQTARATADALADITLHMDIMEQQIRVLSEALRPQLGPERRGIASWYGEAFNGRITANGERYDMMAATVAHPTLPFDTMLLIENVSNGLCVVARVNDRGPYMANRVIDLSAALADQLGFKEQGLTEVRYWAMIERDK